MSSDLKVPPERIAQRPPPRRELCRLLIYHRRTGHLEHTVFKDLPNFLEGGDVLVLNRSKVRPARVLGHKITGGRVEILFLEEVTSKVWKVLLKPSLPSGTQIQLPNGEWARTQNPLPDGENLLACEKTDPSALMEKYGMTPLPPYIKRTSNGAGPDRDRQWYQTVYASTPGSVAAPTAGLHFTRLLLDRLKEKKVHIPSLILHIGWGTFRPIRASNPADHRMLAEFFEVNDDTVRQISRARSLGKRIIGVGTSVVRALESCLAADGTLQAGSGKTDLFIHPPTLVRSVDGMVTNFHLPRTTPLALVDALIGETARRKIYEEALLKGYLFYSYGDAMLIL